MSHAESWGAFLKAFHLVHMIFIFFNFTFLSVFLFLTPPPPTKTKPKMWRRVTQGKPVRGCGAERPSRGPKIPSALGEFPRFFAQDVDAAGQEIHITSPGNSVGLSVLEAYLELLQENQSWHRKKSSYTKWERVSGKKSAIKCVNRCRECSWQL